MENGSLSVAAQLVLRSFSEGGRVTTENAPFSDHGKNFQTFLKTFENASLSNQKNTGIKKPVTGHDSGTTFRFQPFSAALRQEGS